MKLYLFFLFIFSQHAIAQVTMSGFIQEKGSKESLSFVNVTLNGSSIGTSSNSYGFYSIKLPIDTAINVRFSSVGYASHLLLVKLSHDTVINVGMDPIATELKELVITPDNDLSLMKSGGQIQLPLSAVKNSPVLLGEKDVLKTIQLLPGIQRGAEGSVALYVRGGSPDQNLIILDDAPVYNANHLFGFISVFNGDAIKSVEFWKSGFPSRYGGRVSSVIDMQMKDGNKEKINGQAGIGLISSRLTIEGPIKKNKSSFLISSRRSYLDLLVKPLMSPSEQFSYRLYDLNAKVNFDINPKNKIFVSAYLGNDRLHTKEKQSGSQSTSLAETALGWGNATSTIRWNHSFNSKIFTNTTLLFTHFDFYLSDEFEKNGNQPRYELTNYKSSIDDYSIKTDLDYYATNSHHIRTGILLTNHIYKPKAFSQYDKFLNETSKSFELYENQEIGLYLEDFWQPSDRIDFRYGIRLNVLNASFKRFAFVEPRLQASFELVKNLNLNCSYMRANQFVHLLSNTGIGLSTDLWVPATMKAPPQQADQFTIGLIEKFPNRGITVSIESYRKYLRNILSYTEGASFLVISESAKDVSWENNITSGKGLSYGTEILVQKSEGKLTGWIGYTLSWIVHQFDSLNNGQKFFPRYDSRHGISTTVSYSFSPKVLLTMNWVFNTGNALTAPHSYYFTETTNFYQNIYNTSVVPYYGSRNSFRTESYHRMDVAIQFHKQKKKYKRYWEFGIFNAYNRKNPFYYYLHSKKASGQSGQIVELKKRSLFPILPSVSYNVKF